MKILVVNGYSSNYNGTKKFNDLVQVIKDVFYNLLFIIIRFSLNKDSHLLMFLRLLLETRITWMTIFMNLIHYTKIKNLRK
jgi:hypothetical protein